jgi:hypothetical protein
MKLALGMKAFALTGECARHQATVFIQGPKTIFALSCHAGRVSHGWCVYQWDGRGRIDCRRVGVDGEIVGAVLRSWIILGPAHQMSS